MSEGQSESRQSESREPESGPPGDSAHRNLQALIDEIAETSADRPISEVRDRVVAALAAHGSVAPSESWVDAVAREAVHGRAYAVDLETLVGHELASPQQQSLDEAPAELTVVSSADPLPVAARTVGAAPGAAAASPAPASRPTTGGDHTPEEAPEDPATVRAQARRQLAIGAAAAALVVAVTWWRRRRRTRRPPESSRR